MVKQRISTIEDLAVLIQGTMASKEDVRQLEQKMDGRFDKVERLILEDHRKRIEVIELDLKRLKEALAL